MNHLRDERFEFTAFCARQERHARAFNRCVPDLHNLRAVDVGNQADPFGGVDVQVAAEAAGQVEHVELVETDAVVIEDDVQAGDVGALGLRQFVDVAFGEVNRLVARDIEFEPVLAVFKSSE